MADDEPNPDPTQNPTGENPPAPAPGNGQPPGERVFTQAEVNRIVADRLARAKQQPEPPRSAPPPKPNDPPANTAAPDDTRVLLQLRDDFDDATSELPLDGGQKRFLRGLVMDKRPPDVSAFVAETIKQLGLGKSPSPTPNPGNGAPPAPGAPPAANQPPPPAMPSGAPPARVVSDETPFYAMSRDEQAALIKRIGVFEFKKLAFKQLAESGQRFSLRR
jgi:hypothetical protein